MIVFTGSGSYWNTCAGWDEAKGDVWVRSQDKASIVTAIETLEDDDERLKGRLVLLTTMAWDYAYRVHLTHRQWARLLELEALQIDYHKVKPTVSAARGPGHPIAKAVNQIFYWFSDNRTNGTTPAWLGGFGGRKDGSPEIRETSLTGFEPEVEAADPSVASWSVFDGLDDAEPSPEALAAIDEWLERGSDE